MDDHKSAKKLDSPSECDKASADHAAESPLLALPGELRNRIYRFALLAPKPIEITINNCAQPALLRTCATLRSEAIPIYYGKNVFQLMMPGFDTTAATAWYQHGKSHAHHGQPSSIRWKRVSGIRRRTDLVQWLRRIYERDLNDLQPARATISPVHKHLAHLSATIALLRDQSWELVREVLENQIDAAVASGALGFDE